MLFLTSLIPVKVIHQRDIYENRSHRQVRIHYEIYKSIYAGAEVGRELSERF